MIKVLFVYGATLNRGGIEYYMMNYFRYINREKVQIDFAVQGSNQGIFDDEIIKAGSKMFYLPKVGKKPLKFRSELTKIFLSGEYKIVHAHCDAMNYRILKLAKRCGIPVRISHSHNTKHILKRKLKYHFYEFCRKNLVRYATDCWACSYAAGEWLYGKHEFTVIPNAIDTEKFGFNGEKRKELREQYGVQDKEFLLGHIGRFDVQKNHKFLIDLLKKLHNADPKYKLLMVGDGWLKPEIEESVKKYHLEQNVIFAGAVDNPQDYYNMMDLFVLPSLFEGYPLVTKEAEANGLKGVLSNLIPGEVGKLGHFQFCELKVPVWVNAIEKESGQRILNAEQQVRNDGFDICDTAKKMEERYIRLYQKAVKNKETCQ